MKTEEQNVRYLELLTELRDVGRMKARTRTKALVDALTHTQKKLITELRDYVADEASVTSVKE